MTFISLKNVFLRGDKSDKYEILKNINIEVNRHDFIVFKGSSGSGKTKILELISLKRRPSSGGILYKDKNISDIKSKDLNQIKSKIGFAGETPVVMEDKSVYENIEYALKLKKFPKDQWFENTVNTLKLSSLTNKRDVITKKLSSTEKKLLGLSIVYLGNIELLICDYNFYDLSRENPFIKILKKFSLNRGPVAVSAVPEAKIELSVSNVYNLKKGEIRGI
ncbi:MAG: ATP-binding cassette domain-containing protein [Elusimicrobiota bacterium]